MSNYHYIIAGLPNMVLDFKEGKNFSYQDIHNYIAENCSADDLRTVEWFEFCLDRENLSPHTYRAIGKLKNGFIKKYFEFDRIASNLIAEHNAALLNKDAGKYLMGSVPENSEDAGRIRSVLETGDLLEREKQMDKLRWDKANELTVFHYFDMDVILSFLLKASIVERWNRMDKATGTEMFRKLIDEVRGTYKGINNDNQ